MEICNFLGGGGHETIREYEDIKDVFKFAFVRNPWDRFVSAFFCRDRIGSFPINEKGFDQYIKFCAYNFPGAYPRYGVFLMHFKPMYHFLLDEAGEVGVDFVGRFEHLHGNWKDICGQVGIKTPPLEHCRKGHHRHYKHYYTPTTWDIIADIYRRDIELFDYQHDTLYEKQYA